MGKYIIALDEGTTSCRACLYDLEKKKIVKIKANEFQLKFPHTAWVEQDADEIYSKQMDALLEVIDGIDAGDILGLGVTNQRETVVCWNKDTGKAICPAICWQCRRTRKYCDEIKENYSKFIFNKTGLIPDAYFSASKIKWILKNVPEATLLLEKNKLCVGTMDSFLIFNLTKGKSFITDTTNASRTMLFNIHTLKWDSELLKFFEIPQQILPKVIHCTDVAGEWELNGKMIKICGIAGDQQSALVGQCCFNEGIAKITYGTGMFMLLNTGNKPAVSSCGMLSTIAYTTKSETVYALEGSVFNAGSSLQWARDQLGLLEKSSDSEKMAESVSGTHGVYVVPAFTGLGAPYWNSDARGLIMGLSRGTNKNHIVRAILESMAYSAKDLLIKMTEDSGMFLDEIRVDGGASVNNFLMQFQSDILRAKINRPLEKESTAMGVIFLCGLGLGIFQKEDLDSLRQTERIFEPLLDEEKAEGLYGGWLQAVKKCLYEGI